MWFKARILFAEVLAAYACVKALLRRQFVYGVMVAPSDPQLMEGGGTCPICQVGAAAFPWFWHPRQLLLLTMHVAPGLLSPSVCVASSW